MGTQSSTGMNTSSIGTPASSAALYSQQSSATSQPLAYADVVKAGNSLASATSGWTVPAQPLPKPSYTYVAPRDQKKESTQNGTSTPGTPPQKKGFDSERLPQSLREYVLRAFEKAPNPVLRDRVQNELKVMIDEATRKGALWITDWSTKPLPSSCKDSVDGEQKGPTKFQIKSTMLPPKANVIDGLSSPTPKAKQASPAPGSPLIPAKRRKSLYLPDTALSKPIPVDSSSDSDNPSADETLKKLPPSQRQKEIEKRKERAKRFKTDDRKTRENKERENRRVREAFLAAGAEGNPDVIDWDEYTIVGTCKKLEKRYLRLTSAPDPANVRPLHILRQTLELLKEKWKNEQNYTYICDQFKSLRQDLTVQRIKNDFTVAVYETHARIALEKGDLGEYNQCAAQLLQLYKIPLSGNVDEFLGYTILYLILTLNRSDTHLDPSLAPELVKLLGTLTDTDKSGRCVSHALHVRTAVTIGNYHRLFHLYNTAPKMCAYLMDHFAERERLKAMRVICKAYRPDIPIDFVAKELGFLYPNQEDDGMAVVRAREETYEWLMEKGAVFKTDGAGGGKRTTDPTGDAKEKITLDTRASLPVFADLVRRVQAKGVDIKGQIH
ncbi:hypothetical protein HK104_001385 [Borealophlyctis nickersoniae]|nr:hypothetical protein HK104_001385 [Borealophlyctis nickersoniae]